jgi:hypothetical protein
MSYSNFDLLVEHEGEGYRVRLLDSPAGQAAERVPGSPSTQDLESFLGDLGRLPAAGRQEALMALGTELFGALLPASVDTAFRQSLAATRQRGAGLRLRLRLDEVPELAALPWEALYDPVSGEYLAVSTETPLVRYLALPRGEPPLAVAPPLNLLVLVASPVDQIPLDVEGEWHTLEQALSELESGRVHLERLDKASLPALQRRLRQGDYHMLHIVGHGDFDAQRQEGFVLLEGEDRRGLRAGVRELGALLRDESRSLRLVVLNACKGARASAGDPFAGLAQGLVQKGVPAVIAMQVAISDGAAQVFTSAFYSSLASGYPIDAALGEARKAIYLQDGGAEWAVPVLFMRAPDGQIFQVEEEKTAGEAQEKGAAGGVQISIGGSISSSQIQIGDVAGGDIVKGNN